MGKINMGRVLAGGLAAGVVLYVFDGVLNGVILADQWSAFQKSIGKSGEFAPTQLAFFGLLDLVLGIAVVWLYAAVRSRFGAGPGTAVKVALAVWILTALIPNAFLIASDFLPARLMEIGTAVSLVQLIVAALVGGALYKEDAAQVARSATA